MFIKFVIYKRIKEISKINRIRIYCGTTLCYHHRCLHGHVSSFCQFRDQVQITHDQIQSAFFSKLPLEIRMEIYKKVLGQRNIHLGQDKLIRPTTLRIFACNRDDDFTNYHLDCYTPKERANRDKEPKLALLSLPQSCRKM